MTDLAPSSGVTVWPALKLAAFLGGVHLSIVLLPAALVAVMLSPLVPLTMHALGKAPVEWSLFTGVVPAHLHFRN